METNNHDRCAVCVDMGTTNTRVWLVQGKEVLARTQTGVGVRDTARDGSAARVRSALRTLIDEVRSQPPMGDSRPEPEYVAAAGMITSPLGLAEVPHLPAPAGVTQLAAAVRRFSFPEVTNLPVFLIPGVRCGPRLNAVETVCETDVMRGEETLCMGLLALGILRAPATVLNLGSHWKAIQLDAQGRIQSSVTSLSGELIHATQTQTILASALPQDRLQSIDSAWCDSGMKECRRSGLARALFCVRLLELNRQGTPEQRLSFLTGVYLASDLDALTWKSVLAAASPVFITGASALAETWRRSLQAAAIPATTLTEVQIEAGLLAGLRCIVGQAAQRLRGG